LQQPFAAPRFHSYRGLGGVGETAGRLRVLPVCVDHSDCDAAPQQRAAIGLDPFIDQINGVVDRLASGVGRKIDFELGCGRLSLPAGGGVKRPSFDISDGHRPA